jgi:RNA-directed DNA polymerase
VRVSTTSQLRRFKARKAFSLDLLHRKLRDGTYPPRPVKRIEIEKSDGGVRILGIPTVLDRVVHQALVQRMEPIFDPQFMPCSFGYRKGRSPHDAMGKVWHELQAGDSWIVDADLRSYFDTIDQRKLVDLIAEEISDGRVLNLVWAMLQAGVMQDGSWQPTLPGVPQGAVVSPLWSNIYLTPFDRSMTPAGFQLTRWADDLVIVCKSRREAARALALAERFLQDELGVELPPRKTRIVHVQNGFEFLG